MNQKPNFSQFKTWVESAYPVGETIQVDGQDKTVKSHRFDEDNLKANVSLEGGMGLILDKYNYPTETRYHTIETDAFSLHLECEPCCGEYLEWVVRIEDGDFFFVTCTDMLDDLEKVCKEIGALCIDPPQSFSTSIRDTSIYIEQPVPVCCTAKIGDEILLVKREHYDKFIELAKKLAEFSI